MLIKKNRFAQTINNILLKTHSCSTFDNIIDSLWSDIKYFGLVFAKSVNRIIFT